MALDRNAVIKEAQKLAGKGQFDKAIAEWRKLVKDSPHDANIYNTIGDLCLKKNSKPEAVEAYRRAADILAEDGFTSKAIALYKKVLNIDPNQVGVHLALGDMHAEKGLTGNALENYKFVADHYTKQNKKAEALSIYQKMADLNPANVGFRVKLAGMYLKEGMRTEAVKAYLDSADQHIAKGEFQEARKLFEQVLEADPENKAVYHKAGKVYYQEGKLDEARRSLKRAFEADPGNEELLSLYLEVLEKAGRSGDAEDVYRKLLALDPSRSELREKVFQILLDKKDYDKALAEAVAIAEHRFETMDFGGAAAVLTGLIAVTHDPMAAAAALADLYQKKGRAKEGASLLVRAVEPLIERGSPEDAREVLNRALILSPGLAEAEEKLAGLGGAAPAAFAAPAEPEAGAAEAAPPEIEEIAIPPLAEAPPAEQEDPAVAGAISEAEVLIKYGLGAKAAEQLEGLMLRFPDAPRIRARLLDLYRELKQNDKAVLQALMLADFYENRGRMDESMSVLQAALELSPGNPQIMAKLGMAPSAAPEVPEAVEAIEEPEAIEPLAAEAPEELGEVPELAVPELELDTPLVEDLQLPEEPETIETPVIETLAPEEEPEEVAVEQELEPEPAPPPPPRRAAARVVAEPEAADLIEEGDVFASPAPGAAAPDDADVTELWAEAEFYYQQGLFDEARKHYERVLEHRPGDRKAMERIVLISQEKEDVAELSRLAEAVEGLERMVEEGPGAEEASVSRTDVDAVRSLMQEITDLRKGRQPDVSAKPEAPRPEPAAEESFEDLAEELRGGPVPAAPSRGDEPEESFADLADELRERPSPAPAAAPAEKDESGDFFDLAAELRDELSTAPAAAAAAPLHEQSIDEIFEEFKKGVEEHEKKEDEDTHYNLGVAYREMGLLDDAISEFNMTNEGEAKFIQSRYMLGLCYLEKGDYEAAILEIQNALGYSYSFGEASEERIGMHYDLGLAYQGVGNNQASLEELQKVFSLDPSYRDVATKIKELQEGDFISLDTIKEDIEKEISFKFLEEGARIEREEKTKPKKAKK